MIKLSRRQLANFAVSELASGAPSKRLADKLAAILISSRRQKEVDLLISDIERELEDRGQFAKAVVTSASPLPPQILQRLSTQLKKRVGVKELALETRQDNNLIGGFKAETASRSWDLSINKTLNNIREAE